MARLPNINNFNDNRQTYLGVRNAADEVIVFTKEEAKKALIDYIDEELDLMADGITKERQQRLEQMIEARFYEVAHHLTQIIDRKIDALYEGMISEITDSQLRNKLEDKNKRNEQI